LIGKSISEYFEYEVVTKIRVLNEIPFEFPTINICSLNPLVTNEFIEFENNFLRMATNKTFDANVSFNLEEILILKSKFTLELNTNVNETSFHSMFFNLSDFVIDCTFDKVQCNKSDFKESLFAGKCLEFNSNTLKKKTFKNGLNSGLNMEFYLPELSSLSYSKVFLNRFYGLRIFIRNVTYNSFEDLNAIDVKPGTMTLIELKKNFIERMPYPYSDCFINYGNIEYRKINCIDSCMQKNIVNECKCYSTWFGNFNLGVNACLNSEELACAQRVFNNLNKFSDDCSINCPNSCFSINFDYFTSISDFPTRRYFSILKNNNIVKKQLENENISNLTYEAMKERVLSFNIFFNKLVYTKISETEKVRLVDMIAGIG
jgi:hypothetical protein